LRAFQPFDLGHPDVGQDESDGEGDLTKAYGGVGQSWKASELVRVRRLRKVVSLWGVSRAATSQEQPDGAARLPCRTNYGRLMRLMVSLTS
jgi:hypothetical protein